MQSSIFPVRTVWDVACPFTQLILSVGHVEDSKINTTTGYCLTNPYYVLGPLKCTTLQRDEHRSLKNKTGFHLRSLHFTKISST